MATLKKAPTKTAALLATQAKMRAQKLATQAKMKAQAKKPNGGKSEAQMVTEAKMRMNKADTNMLDPDVLRANRAVSAEIDPQINVLNQATKRQTDLGKRQQSDLTHLYGILNKTIGNNAAQGSQSFVAANSAVGNNFNQAAQNIDSQFGKAKVDTTNELSRLGLNAAAPGATQELTRDQSFLGGLNTVDKANAQSGLAANNSAYQQLATLMQGSTQQEGTSQVANAARDNANMLTDLQTQIGNLQAQKPNKIYEALSALRDARGTAEQEEAQRRFENSILQARVGLEGTKADQAFRIDRSKLDLERTKINQSFSTDRARLGLDAEKIKLDQRKIDSDYKSTMARLATERAKTAPGSLESRKVDAAIELQKSQYAKNMAEAQKAARVDSVQNEPKGLAAAQQFAAQAAGSNGQLANDLGYLIGLSMQQPDLNSSIRALDGSVKLRGYSPAVASALFTAAEIAWRGRK